MVRSLTFLSMYEQVAGTREMTALCRFPCFKREEANLDIGYCGLVVFHRGKPLEAFFDQSLLSQAISC